MTRSVFKTHCAHAVRRVVHYDVAAADLGQHNEVIEVPMQNRGQVELAELIQLNFERSRRKIELMRELRQMRKRRAARRNRVVAAQLGKIDFIAVRACNHGEAGQTAFRRLGLQHQRRAPATYKLQNVLGSDHVLSPYTRPVTESSGANTHSIKRRRSSDTSASNAMPLCSGICLP